MRSNFMCRTVLMITFDFLVERATATRMNAAGLRPLAHHVRALYPEICALREDGVGYKLVATVLCDVRGEFDADPLKMSELIRIYHYRDRKAHRPETPPPQSQPLPIPADPRPSLTADTARMTQPHTETTMSDLDAVTRAIRDRTSRKRLIADKTA